MSIDRIDASPRALARLEGVVYLVIIILGVVVELVVRARINVPGNAAATAANLRSMESLWRFGIAAELVMVICTIVSALILYVLLRPVSKDLALLGTFFGLVGITIEAAHSLRLVEALFPLQSAGYLQAFSPGELQAMVSWSMKAHGQGYGLALLVFGPAFLLRGYLVYRSGYFPRALGVLYQIAGLAYLTNGFSLILAPQLAGRIFMIVAGPAFVGEASFCIWLLAKGLNVDKLEPAARRGSVDLTEDEGRLVLTPTRFCGPMRGDADRHAVPERLPPAWNRGLGPTSVRVV